jgi:hypothetical protein
MTNQLRPEPEAGFARNQKAFRVRDPQELTQQLHADRAIRTRVNPVERLDLLHIVKAGLIWPSSKKFMAQEKIL